MFDQYTKIVINNVSPKYKRAVKIKDELIPFESGHFIGKGEYKRILCRYNKKEKIASLVFLGYSPKTILTAIKGDQHEDFRCDISYTDIDLTLSGEVHLETQSDSDCIYHYKIKNYIPFSSDSYKQFDQLKRHYSQSTYLQHVKNPTMRHFLLTHLYLHVRYLMRSLSIYTKEDYSGVKLQIVDQVSHQVTQFKSKESSFSFEFTSNTFLPIDLNVGNHVAYGFGALTLVGQWQL